MSVPRHDCRSPRRLRATLALAAVLALGAVRADASDWLQEGREPPLHPSLIMAGYEGKEYPVMAVAAEIPEIEAGGKLRKLKGSPSYQTPRAVDYAPGYIRFTGQNATAMLSTYVYKYHGDFGMGSATIPAGTVSETGDYECTLVASEPHADCYLAVIFYRKDGDGQPDMGSAAIAFRNVGDLAAGRETKVRINRAYAPPAGTQYFMFPLVFSKGFEIRSDQSEYAARFFRLQEMTAHGLVLARYRETFPTADHAAVAYVRFQPQLPYGVDPRSLPATISAKFAVTETGEVDSVEFAQPLDPLVASSIRRGLEGWLFLPRLRGGYPVRSMVEVPLGFGQSPP